MNEIIASILDAEKTAEEIVKKAADKSKSIRETADNDGEKIKNSAVAVFKLHRAALLKDAELRAEEEYDKILKDGETQAEEIVKSVSGKIDAFAEEAVKGIIG